MIGDGELFAYTYTESRDWSLQSGCPKPKIPRQIELPIRRARRISKLPCILGRGVSCTDAEPVQTPSGEAALERSWRDFSEAMATTFEETVVSGSSSQLVF